MKFKKPKLLSINSKNIVVIFRFSLECFFLSLILFSLCSILGATSYFEVCKFAVETILVAVLSFAIKKI